MSPAAHDSSSKSIVHHNNRKRKASDAFVDTIMPFLIDGLPPITTQTQIIASKNINKREINVNALEDEKKAVSRLIDLAYPSLVCPCCLRVSRAKAESDEHMKNEHRGTKMFECLSTQCSQIYTTKAGLKYHMEHVHHVVFVNSSGSKNPIKSQKSKVTVPETKQLKKLQLSPKLAKLLDDAYSLTTCPSCCIEFKKKTHVVHHLVEEHHGEEPYKCVVKDCKRTKTYATRDGLLYHLVNYHDHSFK
ncbi:hypothetical protein BD560DRAFT_356939 [Blakeslea trispora]|nr:hypothetical protein BD560DRAFT_356939 [Blakeslea trispora]